MRWITKVESGKARSRKRAAVYCQVSTDKEDQLDSLENQMKSFQLRIQQHKDWNLVNIYTDEGISGTSIRHRVQFLEMQVRRAFLYQEASSFPSVTSTGGQNPPIEQFCGHQGLMINSAGKPGAGKANSTLRTFSSLSVSNFPEPLSSHWKIRTSSFTFQNSITGSQRNHWK